MRKVLRTVLGCAVLMGSAFVATPEASGAAEGKRIALFIGAKIKEHFEGKPVDKAVWMPFEPITKANLAKYEEACSY